MEEKYEDDATLNVMRAAHRTMCGVECCVLLAGWVRKDIPGEDRCGLNS